MKKIFVIIMYLFIINDLSGKTVDTVFLAQKHITKYGVNLITSFEGFRSVAYRCPAGVLTIGFGTTKNVYAGQVVTKKQAIRMFRKDVKRFENVVKRRISRALYWYEYDALTSFAYNLGDRFHSRFRNDINRGRTEAVCKRMNLYNKARVRGKLRVLRGLTRRRVAETDFYKFNFEVIYKYK